MQNLSLFFFAVSGGSLGESIFFCDASLEDVCGECRETQPKKSKCNNDLKVLLGSCLFIYGFFPCGVDALSKTELDSSSDYVGYLKVV